MQCSSCSFKLLRVIFPDLSLPHSLRTAKIPICNPRHLPHPRLLSSSAARPIRQSAPDRIHNEVSSSEIPRDDLYIPFDKDRGDHVASKTKSWARSIRHFAPAGAIPRIPSGPSPSVQPEISSMENSPVDWAPEIDVGEAHTGSAKAAIMDLTPESIETIAAEALAKKPNQSASARQRTVALEGNTSSHSHKTASSRSSAKVPASPTRQLPPRPAWKRLPWQIQKDALRSKLSSQPWQPPKRLSPDALDGIRALHAQYPDKFTTPILAEHFAVSPDAIRRILKSKWRPSAEEEEERRERWLKRGEKIWQKLGDAGVKPPRMWREKGIRLNRAGGVPSRIGPNGSSSRTSGRARRGKGTAWDTVQHEDPERETLSDRIL